MKEEIPSNAIDLAQASQVITSAAAPQSRLIRCSQWGDYKRRSVKIDKWRHERQAQKGETRRIFHCTYASSLVQMRNRPLSVRQVEEGTAPEIAS